MSEGVKLSGNLFTPPNYNTGNKYPAILIINPATGVKEQVAGVYAKFMAEKGYITLAFDHTGYGESDGTPRTREDLFVKTLDIKHALSYLCSLEEVNKNKIGAIGICAGASYLLETAIGETRIAAMATISGTLSYQGIISNLGEDKILSAAGEARQKYDETGKTTYVPVINKPKDKSDIFANETYDYYLGNQAKYPSWRNQADVTSFSNLASLNIKDVVGSYKKPVLFVAGSKASTKSLSESAYEYARNSTSKELHIVEGATHISLYHNEEQINEVSERIDEFFIKNLKQPPFQGILKSLIGSFIGLTYESNNEDGTASKVQLTETRDDYVVTRKVAFRSHGTLLIGNLFLPVSHKKGEQSPGIVFVGPSSSVKEQVGGEYAYRLAKKGFITLAFDHRTFGESDGTPRCTEDILLKSEDIRSAISYICSLEEVNKDRVGAIGICGGGGFLIQIAPGERRVKAFATISGTLSAKKVVEDMPGGSIILSISNDAMQRHDLSGESTYMRLFAKKRPKLSKKKPRQSKFQQEAFEYYVLNSDKHPNWRPDAYLGVFSNIASFDIPRAVKSISHAPVLFITGTEAFTAPLNQRAYDAAEGDKELCWIEGATHVGLYYQEDYMNQVTEKLNIYFSAKLN